MSRAGSDPDRGAVACTTEQAVLGEGARWDARRDELLRVDIVAGRVFRDRVAADVLRGDMPVTHWADEHPFLLDVRQPAELAVEQVPGVVNIPLPELRGRLDELPRDREIHVICRSGQRAYYATRILLQNGFDARNISGGMLSHEILGVG